MRASSAAVLALALVGSGCDRSPTELRFEVDHVTVLPGGRTVAVGDTVLLSSFPATLDSIVLGGLDVTWSSASPTVAAVEYANGYGRLIALAPGTVEISADVEGRRGTVAFEVVAEPLAPASLSILPASVTLDPDRSHRLEARLSAADGRLLAGPIVTWTTSDGPRATVLPDASTLYGIVSAQRSGTVIITARHGSLEAVAEIRVR